MTTQAARLWMLLDDIDTADDMAKSNDKFYRGIVQKIQRKRFEIMSGEEVDAAFGRASGCPEYQNGAPVNSTTPSPSKLEGETP